MFGAMYVYMRVHRARSLPAKEQRIASNELEKNTHTHTHNLNTTKTNHKCVVHYIESQEGCCVCEIVWDLCVLESFFFQIEKVVSCSYFFFLN